MRTKTFLPWLFVLTLLAVLLRPAATLAASQPVFAPPRVVTAYELIAAMNTLRVSYGLQALIEDPIINAVAQATAETMAANQMSWHIGDVRGRLASAGYGGGATVWATENFAVGNMAIDEIMVVWADPDHMRPAVTAAYCHIGAGVALASNGRYYYVLQAAYTSANSCGAYTSPGTTPRPGAPPVSQVILPVKIATPDAEGNIFHVVEAGQSVWAIAVAYQITIRDIEIWNNISRETPLRVGQRLFIPGINTEGYATPTPVGMIVPATPDAEGKIIHSVQPYQALITIAAAYGVTVERILALNGIQEDWPLQIGQKLIISPGWVTPSATPRPLTPIEKLTPASDGKYYHVVKSGETLLWIAGLYEVTVAELMAWNGLTDPSLIYENQNLLLQVTPPVTATFTPRPPSDTAAPTAMPPPPTAPVKPTVTRNAPTATATPTAEPSAPLALWPFALVLAGGGLLILGLFLRRRG